MNTYTKYVSTVLAFVFVFSLALSANAQTWVGPTGTPPNFNTPAPVNVGSFGQVKSGWLHLGSQIPGGFKFGVDGPSVFSGAVSINPTGNVGNFFKVNDGTANTTSLGSVLTNDGTGVAKWMPAGGASLTPGAANNTLYWNATTGAWTPNTELLSNGTNVRIGSGFSFGGIWSTLKFGVSGTSLFNGDTAFINDAGTTHVRIGLPLMPSTSPYDTVVLGITGLSAFDGDIIGAGNTNLTNNVHLSQNPTFNGANTQTTVGPQQIFPSNIKFGVTGGQVRFDDGSAAPGYVLTSSDAQGTAYWAPVSSNPSPGTGGTTIANGTLNDTLRWNGTVWEPSSNLSNDTNRVVVGANIPGTPGAAKFQINKEGDSTGNDWYAHPLTIQGNDQTLYFGVDSSTLRRSSYIQSADTGTAANGLLLNPLGGNVRIGSGAAQSFPTGGIPLSGSFTAPGTNNIYPNEFSNTKLGVTGGAMFRGPLWIIDGDQGLGKVLTSNADGLAEWKPGLPIGTTTNNGQTLVWNNNTNTWEFSDLDVGPVVEGAPDADINDTLRWDGTKWVASNFMNNNDTTVSIARQGVSVFNDNYVPVEIFSAKATGLFNGSTKGLKVYETGTTETNGLLVDGSANVQGNLTVGSDTSNKLTNLFGKLKVKVANGTIAEFLGKGDFIIKKVTNSSQDGGAVTIGQGTSNGIPLTVSGNIIAQAPNTTPSPTGISFIQTATYSCFGANIPNTMPVSSFYSNVVGNLSPANFQCSNTSGITYQQSNALSNGTTNANDCSMPAGSWSSDANLKNRNCPDSSYDAALGTSAGAKAYELYVTGSGGVFYDSSGVLYVNGGGTGDRAEFSIIEYTATPESVTGGQGVFIGRGARLYSLSAQSGSQKVCSNSDGWLIPCNEAENSSPALSWANGYASDDDLVVYKTSDIESGTLTATAAAFCPTAEYIPIGGGGRCTPEDSTEHPYMTRNEKTYANGLHGWTVTCSGAITAPANLIVGDLVLRPGGTTNAQANVICMKNDLLSY